MRLDWRDALHGAQVSYVMGNPPFIGKAFQNDEQKADMAAVFHGVHGARVLDFVAGWYMVAARYIEGTGTEVAFVSTNSIVQGEQIGILWGALLPLGLKINFAHRTFQWTNEARGVAGVHCVIIGFAMRDREAKMIYEYDDYRGEPHASAAKRINPYLVDGPDVLLQKRGTPISPGAKAIAFGSMPNDGGHLILSDEQRDELVAAHPEAEQFLRVLLGSEEFINRSRRWCLWLVNASPKEIRAIEPIANRVQEVQRTRGASTRAETRALAAYPALFGENRQPTGNYMLIPSVSSERRSVVPMGFMGPEIITSNLAFVMPDATLYEFGVLTSRMHSAWIRYTCGRLESRYRYSKDIVYNNFPWPDNPTAKIRERIEEAAAEIIKAREAHPDSTLADLYDPIATPPDLVRAHARLDAAVDAAYGRKAFANDAERVVFLFVLYERMAAPLAAAAGAPRRRRVALP